MREHPSVGPLQPLDRLMCINPTKSFQSWVICQADMPAETLHSPTSAPFAVASPVRSDRVFQTIPQPMPLSNPCQEEGDFFL